MATFTRMERWLSDGVDVAGETFAQFVEGVCQDNKLYTAELTLGGEHVDRSRVDMPVLQLTAENDHLFPPETSTPFNDVIASEDTTVIECPTGHAGLLVSGRSHETVRPRICEWFGERSPADPATTDSEDAA